MKLTLPKPDTLWRYPRRWFFNGEVESYMFEKIKYIGNKVYFAESGDEFEGIAGLMHTFNKMMKGYEKI